METDSDALVLAGYLVSIYGEPAYRVDAVEINMGALTSAQHATVLALDITSVVSLKFTPNNIGSPIELDLIVTGIEHTIAPKQHTVVLSCVAVDTFAMFVLDGATLGVLDTNALAF